MARFNKFQLFILLLSCLIFSPAQAQTVPVSQAQIQLSYASLVKKTAPAVVNIYSARKVRVVSPLLNDPFFQQFFGSRGLGIEQSRQVNSLGSGVIVKPNGLIVTNYHVVKDSTEIKVVLADRREFEADVKLADEKTDLAILQLRNAPGDLPFLTFHDSDDIEVGDLVLAIGNPFGVGQTVTSGIVSALARTTLGISDYQFFIQTDAAINPGNSGGALINMNGEVIGINSAIYTRSGGSNGIGFAIPANMVRAVIEGAGSGKIQRAWLGASLQDITPDIAESLGLSTPLGVLVKDVYKDGPAANAGVKQGDALLKINGREIENGQSLRYRLATLPLNSTCDLAVWRDGKEFTLKLPLKAPTETTPREQITLKGNHPMNGVTVANLSPAVSYEMGITENNGVIVTGVAGGGVSFLGGGFQPGDLIKEINGTAVTSTKQLQSLLEKSGKSWRIILSRGGQLVRFDIRL